MHGPVLSPKEDQELTSPSSLNENVNYILKNTCYSWCPLVPDNAVPLDQHTWWVMMCLAESWILL